jgi:hypothetical protein
MKDSMAMICSDGQLSGVTLTKVDNRQIMFSQSLLHTERTSQYTEAGKHLQGQRRISVSKP